MRKSFLNYRHNLFFDMNAVIRGMIASDVIFMGSLGLIGPIFALFVVDFIEGADASVVGTAVAIFFLTKSLLQLPFATLIDAIKGEMDDFWILIIGSLVTACIPLLYLVIGSPGELYLVQLIYGIATAATFPSYMAIYTRHIDKQKEGSEWGMYYMMTDFTAAVTASLGGYLAQSIGFQPLIVIVVVMSVLGISILIPLRPYMQKAKKRRHV